MKSDLDDSSKGRSLILWTIVGGFILFLVLASWVQIDQVTRGTGTVISSSRVQIIQSVDGGVLETLPVKEGDHVSKGQLLATLNQTRVAAAVKELDSKLAGLRAQAIRLRAEITGSSMPNFARERVSTFPEQVRVQQSLFVQRRQSISEELRTLSEAGRLAREDARLVHALAKTGDVSQSEMIRVDRAVNEAEAQLNNRKNKYLQDAQSELAKAEDDIGQIQEQRTQRVQQLEDSVFRASVPGIIKNVRVTTLGGVLKGGEELMQIVPVDDELIVEVKIKPSDIAQLKSGLNAHIRFDPFDYTIYGAVNGTVAYVSADTLREDTKSGEQTYYRVHVKTPMLVQSLSGRTLEILPGMTAQVDVRTGERSLLNYLLKPIRKTLTESLGER
jgi:adhesin transport system membrane fusion protein